MTIVVAFIGQSVGNYMFTVSDNPPPCPSNCYMLNRATLAWGPVTGNGAIEYATHLAAVTGQEVRLYNACYDNSAMVATYAPPATPDLYWSSIAGDSPLASFAAQLDSPAAAGYVPQLLELNQGQAEFQGGMTDPNVWVYGFTTMYGLILAHCGKTSAQMPINIWTGMRGGVAGTSPYVFLAHQQAASTIAGAALGVSYYDGQTVDSVHPTAGWHQVNGARAAAFALKRLGNAAFAAADSGPKIVSATHDSGIFYLLGTSGHPLRVDGRNLTGFQAWRSDYASLVPVLGATVLDPCTIGIVLQSPVTMAYFRYMGDCIQPGSAAVYDTQNCFARMLGMPMVPCMGVQSAS